MRILGINHTIRLTSKKTQEETSFEVKYLYFQIHRYLFFMLPTIHFYYVMLNCFFLTNRKQKYQVTIPIMVHGNAIFLSCEFNQIYLSCSVLYCHFNKVHLDNCIALTIKDAFDTTLVLIITQIHRYIHDLSLVKLHIWSRKNTFCIQYSLYFDNFTILVYWDYRTVVAPS